MRNRVLRPSQTMLSRTGVTRAGRQQNTQVPLHSGPLTSNAVRGAGPSNALARPAPLAAPAMPALAGDPGARAAHERSDGKLVKLATDECAG